MMIVSTDPDRWVAPDRFKRKIARNCLMGCMPFR
jgi:hypothetical protein